MDATQRALYEVAARLDEPEAWAAYVLLANAETVRAMPGGWLALVQAEAAIRLAARLSAAREVLNRIGPVLSAARDVNERCDSEALSRLSHALNQ